MSTPSHYMASPKFGKYLELVDANRDLWRGLSDGARVPSGVPETPTRGRWRPRDRGLTILSELVATFRRAA